MSRPLRKRTFAYVNNSSVLLFIFILFTLCSCMMCVKEKGAWQHSRLLFLVQRPVDSSTTRKRIILLSMYLVALENSCMTVGV